VFHPRDISQTVHSKQPSQLCSRTLTVPLAQHRYRNTNSIQNYLAAVLFLESNKDRVQTHSNIYSPCNLSILCLVKMVISSAYYRPSTSLTLLVSASYSPMLGGAHYRPAQAVYMVKHYRTARRGNRVVAPSSSFEKSPFLKKLFFR